MAQTLKQQRITLLRDINSLVGILTTMFQSMVKEIGEKPGTNQEIQTLLTDFDQNVTYFRAVTQRANRLVIRLQKGVRPQPVQSQRPARKGGK